MSVTRRQALATAAGLAAAGLRPARAQTAAAGKQVKLLIVRASQFQAQFKRLPEFTTRTGITVTPTEVPFPAMREKLTAELVAGSADFDVVSVMDAWVPSMTAGYLAPIGPELQAHGVDLANFPAAFTNAGTVDGKVYGAPIRASTQLLYYRKDLLGELGLQPPRTWAEVVTTGRTLQDKKNIAGIAMYYGKNNGQNLMQWYDFLWTNGAEYLDNKLQPLFNSPEGLQATQVYVDLLLKDKVVPVGAASFDEQAAATSMLLGNSAMLPVWNWQMSRFAEPSAAVKVAQVGFSPLPTVRAGASPTTYTNTWVLGLNNRSANKDAALQYIAWATSPEVARSILLDPKENEVVAVHWSNLRDPDVNARWHGLQETGAKSLEAPKLIPQFAELPQVTEVVEAAMSSIATGAAEVKPAMDNAARQVARITRRAGR